VRAGLPGRVIAATVERPRRERESQYNQRRVSTLPATEKTMRLAAILLLALALPRAAVAQDAPRLASDDWPVRSTGRVALDGGLVMSSSATLGTGLATGVGAGVTYGRRFAFGARASWATSTESSTVWLVTHDDYRLRAVAAVQQAAGRGVFALRLGLGTTVVHEDRTRNQGARAGLTGSDLMTSATAALPAGEVEAVISVHVMGPWLLTLGGGPSALLESGALRGGWTTQLGVGWQP
jgi:hypothetical protein